MMIRGPIDSSGQKVGYLNLVSVYADSSDLHVWGLNLSSVVFHYFTYKGLGRLKLLVEEETEDCGGGGGGLRDVIKFDEQDELL